MTEDPLFDRTWDTLAVQRDESVVEVRLKRPDDSLNRFNKPLIQDLTEFAQQVRRRADVQVIVVTGGDEIFSEGSQLEAIKLRLAAPTLLARRETVITGGDMCSAWENIEAITIAAVEGRCRGAGVAFALCCDFRILSEEVEFFIPEVPLGLNMGWGTIPRLTSLIGPARTKRFAIFGEAPKPTTCVEWGLADEVCPAGSSTARAHDWAQRLCSLPPVPVRMAKASVNASANALHDATSYMDRDQYLLTAPSEDFDEGVAAFLEERAPKFKGN